MTVSLGAALPARERVTAAPPSKPHCDSCLHLGAPCPHDLRDANAHEHSRDGTCFAFLLKFAATTEAQTPVPAGITRPGEDRLNRRIRRYERERLAHAAARLGNVPAAYYSRSVQNGGRVSNEPAQSLFPLLAILNERIAINDRHSAPMRWLKAYLYEGRETGLGNAAHAAKRSIASLEAAALAAAERVCRDELPRRYRLDLREMHFGAGDLAGF